jgi:thioredoxin-related protein
MKNFILACLFIIPLSATAQNSSTASSAEAILKEAYSRAAKEHKNVLVMFHASWCVWCHRMDSSINDVTCKSFFDNNYVITHLTVDELDGNKTLENSGANEFRTKYNGDGQGIPYWLIFDKNGKLLADSRFTDGNNIGCPANPQEVDYFITLLKKTSKLTDDELAIIARRFRQNQH